MDQLVFLHNFLYSYVPVKKYHSHILDYNIVIMDYRYNIIITESMISYIPEECSNNGLSQLQVLLPVNIHNKAEQDG